MKTNDIGYLPDSIWTLRYKHIGSDTSGDKSFILHYANRDDALTGFRLILAKGDALADDDTAPISFKDGYFDEKNTLWMDSKKLFDKLVIHGSPYGLEYGIVYIHHEPLYYTFDDRNVPAPT